MKILVTTPAGHIGRRVLWELLAPEFSVRVIARNPARLPEEIREQVEVICGSSDHAATLRRALEGVDALFWCVPPEAPREMNVRGHYERFARAVCQAIRQAGTPRVVTISAAGRGRAPYEGPLSGLHAMEDILNESGAAIRHLRCGCFMENLLWQAQAMCERGIFSYPIPGQIPIPLVAASDVADVALRWLAQRHWTGLKAVAVPGPEDLSCSQVAAVLEQVLKRRVRYRETGHDAQALAGPAGEDYAGRWIKAFAELAPGITREESTALASTTATTLAAWAEGELLPLVDSFRESRTEVFSISV